MDRIPISTPTPRILMCRPDFYGIEYEINPWMNRQVASDAAESHQQWRALEGTLRGLGVEIELLEPVPGLPDLVFTANAGLVFHQRFISSRFRYGVRQGETPHFDRWAREYGFDVVTLPPGLNFEGAGDALFCGETLFAGYRFRSDARSHLWIGEVLGVEVLPLELVDPRFYHLDTCFCPLARDAAIYYPGAFDDYGRSVLQDRIPLLIAVSGEEAVTFSCNAVVVGRRVIMNEETPKLAHALRQAGFEVRPLRLTEFIKAGGSAKCLTLRLDGEEAAAWKHRPTSPPAMSPIAASA
jgi:N-dimethylarginine dimethylaminohydrolase